MPVAIFPTHRMAPHVVMGLTKIILADRFIDGPLNASAGADLVSTQSNVTVGVSHHTGRTIIANGTEESELRIGAAMTTDAGIGIIRYAQSGYEIAREVSEGKASLTNDTVRVPSGGRRKQLSGWMTSDTTGNGPKFILRSSGTSS